MRWRIGLITVAAAGALSLTSPARASEDGQLTAELGLADFTGAGGNHLHPGPSLGLSGAVPLLPRFSLVIGYLGALVRLDDPEIPAASRLTSNAGYAAARLSVEPGRSWRAYAFAGVGLLRTEVPNDARPRYRSLTAALVPAGLGLEFDISRHIAIGGRFTYHLAIDNTLQRDRSSDSTDLWSGTVTGAWRFR